jgi:hypothetical protein
MSVPKNLKDAAATFAQRNKLYGDNYKKFGPLVEALFPEGVTLKSAADHARFALLIMICSKISRYAANFSKGGHADSIHDAIVYCAMLEETDEAARLTDQE